MRACVISSCRRCASLVNSSISESTRRDESIELCQYFADVGGDLGQRTREDAEIVVAIHLQLTEFS